MLKTAMKNYTREQKIEDGVLFNVGETAEEIGINYPVAVTQAVWAEVVTPDAQAKEIGETEDGRLWDLLMRFVLEVNAAPSIYTHQINENGQPKEVQLKVTAEIGTNSEPVVTIMLPRENS